VVSPWKLVYVTSISQEPHVDGQWIITFAFESSCAPALAALSETAITTPNQRKAIFTAIRNTAGALSSRGDGELTYSGGSV